MLKKITNNVEKDKKMLKKIKKNNDEKDRKKML